MAKTVIVSPHTDDAIFSLGSYISLSNDDITVLTPFAKIPDDKVGKKKHTILRKEHTKACKFLGVKEINGEFLDDVYRGRNLSELKGWIYNNIKEFDKIFVPIGIHHPDHILIRNIIMNYFKNSIFYGELPYMVLYPELLKPYLKREYIKFEHTKIKEQAVRIYDSQIDDNLCKQLFVKEILWSHF